MLAQLFGYLASIGVLIGAGILSGMFLLSPALSNKTDGAKAGKHAVAQNSAKPQRDRKVADETDRPNASQLLGKKTAAVEPEVTPAAQADKPPAQISAKKKTNVAKSASAKVRKIARTPRGGTDVLGYAPTRQVNAGPFFFGR